MPSWNWDEVSYSKHVMHEDVTDADPDDATRIQKAYDPNSPLFSSSLDAYYPMQEDTGTTLYDFQGSYHGNYNGVSVGGGEGILGSTGPLFDGNDDTASLDNTVDSVLDQAPFSICAWVYPTATHSYDDYNYVFCARNNSAVYMNENIGNWRVAVTNTDNQLAEVNSSNSIKTNEWTHLALVLTSSELILYEDAVQVGSDTWYGGYTNSYGQSVMISQKPWDSAQGHFDGTIQDLRIYGNKSLAKSELEQIIYPVTQLGEWESTKKSL